jgi:hypothetical protein
MAVLTMGVGEIVSVHVVNLRVRGHIRVCIGTVH